MGPSLYSTPLFITASTTTGLPSQHQHTSQEESNQINSKAEQKQDDHFSTRYKKKVLPLFKKVNIRLAEYSYRQKAHKSISGLTFFTRPAYYSFLSLYHLF